MKTYIPNNISFRIVSSNSIAKFKQDQAFDFYEIVKQANNISPAGKEVILLEYEHWFKWILKLEKVFLLVDAADTKEMIFDRVNQLLKNEMIDISEIMAINSEFFADTHTRFISFIHHYALPVLRKVIYNALEENDLGCSFSKIVFFISLYLQQVLLSIQEIEQTLRNTSTSIKLFYAGWDKEICELFPECCSPTYPIEDRAKYYLNLNPNISFVIYNLTHHQVMAACVENITNNGISITEIKNEHVA